VSHIDYAHFNDVVPLDSAPVAAPMAKAPAP
jgi:inward rectifier potassium channel